MPKRTISSSRTKKSAAVSPPATLEPGFELRILQSLRRIIRAMEIHSRRLVASHRVTTHQLVCLLTIKDMGPIKETDIAREAQLSSSTVVGILSRLEEKGLIRRERNVRDRRQVLVTATAKGRRLAARLPLPLQDGLARALRELPELEQMAIALSLERIVELMEGGAIPGEQGLAIIEDDALSATPTVAREV